MTTAEARARLHDLIESLPTADVPTALRLLEALHQVPPALRDVPIDDEPETAEERVAVAEARRELDDGKGIPHDEVMGFASPPHGVARNFLSSSCKL